MLDHYRQFIAAARECLDRMEAALPPPEGSCPEAWSAGRPVVRGPGIAWATMTDAEWQAYWEAQEAEVRRLEALR
jgi:hypothetical protein